MKIPTSILGRGGRILKMATKVAIEEASSRLKTWEDEKEKLKSKLEVYREVVNKLSELKGASMKVGQVLGMDLGHLLPPEVARVFEELHRNGKELPFPQISSIIQSELREKALDFRDIHERPLGSASIGQVHRANLQGENVVLKVQYPGIAEAIPTDLKLLSMVLNKLPILPGFSKVDMGFIFQEIEELLLQEADYAQELKMNQLYLEKFKHSPYRVPKAYPEYSTKKLLTLEYLPGQGLTDWLRNAPTEVEKIKLARRLIELYLEETFVHGLVQTDPNPGNFLVMDGGTLGLLDFGAVKQYDQHFIEGYRKILLAAFRHDDQEVLRLSVELGLLDQREEVEVKETYAQVVNFLAAPFRDAGHFEFSDKNFMEKSMDLSWKLGRSLRYTQPPRELLFLHRKLGGIFLLLRKMNISLDLKEYQDYVSGLSVRREPSV